MKNYLVDQFFDAVWEKNDDTLAQALKDFGEFIRKKLGKNIVFQVDKDGELLCSDFKDAIVYLESVGKMPKEISEKTIKEAISEIMKTKDDVTKELELYQRSYEVNFPSSFLKFFIRKNIKNDAKDAIVALLNGDKRVEIKDCFSDSAFDMKRGSPQHIAKSLELRQDERFWGGDWGAMLAEQEFAEKPLDELHQDSLNIVFGLTSVWKSEEEQVVPVLYSAIAAGEIPNKSPSEIIKENPSYSIARDFGFKAPVTSAEKAKFIDAFKYVRDKRKPFSFPFCNNGHFATLVLYPDGEDGVASLFFDGMATLERSYAKPWVKEIDKFLTEVCGEGRANYTGMRDCHRYVQTQNNCWLSISTFIGILIARCAKGEVIDIDAIKQEVSAANIGSTEGCAVMLRKAQSFLTKAHIPTFKYQEPLGKGFIDLPIFCFHIFLNIDWTLQRIHIINTMYFYMSETNLQREVRDVQTPLAPSGIQYCWIVIVSIFSEKPLIEASGLYMHFLEAQHNAISKLQTTQYSPRPDPVLCGDFSKIVEKCSINWDEKHEVTV